MLVRRRIAALLGLPLLPALNLEGTGLFVALRLPLGRRTATL
jgi:hypothetical protein